MAHLQDLWEKTVDGRRVRTDRYGKGGRWQARYYDPDGRERTRMFDRRQDADRFLITVSADVLRGAYVDPDAGKVTFAEFAERWLAAQTFGESSREATELRLRLHAGRHFGTRELRNIKPSVIQSWLRKLQQELAPTYVRTVFTNVAAVFNAAVDDGLIASNPCRAGSVKLPKREQRKIEPWPVEQVEAVIGALPERYGAIGVVAAGCGLRQGEVFGLRVRDVDLLIDAGESVRAVADYLGHADPSFTLRVYSHLLPASDDRARRAVDAILAAGPRGRDRKPRTRLN